MGLTSIVGEIAEYILGWSVRHPRRVVTGILALIVASVIMIPRIEVRLDARALLPANEPELQLSDKLGAVFEQRDVVVLALVGETQVISSPDSSARLQRLSQALSGVRGIVPGSVASLSTLPTLTVERGTLNVAPLVKDGFNTAPLAARLRALGMDDGVLVSRDGRVAAIYADVEPAADRAELSRAIRALAQHETASGLTVRAGGNALAQAELGYAAASDLVRLMPAMLIVLFVILFLVYRSVWVAMLVLIEIGAALILTGGTMGITQQSLFVTTLVFPVVLLAIGVSDDVYAIEVWLSRWDGEPGQSLETSIVTAFRAAALPIAFSALITIAGLLSTAISRLEPLRTFGLFGALAIGISSLFTFTLVPALLALLGPRLRGSMRRGDGCGGLSVRLARAIAAPSLRRPRVVFVALVAVSIGASVIATKVRVNDSWIGNLPARSELSRDTAVLDRHLAGMTPVDFVYERPGTRLTDPATFVALDQLAQRIAAIDGVGAVSSVADHVVRALAQFAETTTDALHARLHRGEQISGPELEQMLVLLQSAGPQHLRKLVDPLQARAHIRVFVRDADARRIGALVEEIRATAGDATITPFGDGWVSYVTVHLLVTSQLRSIGLAALVTLALMFVVFRSWRLAAAAAVPALLAIAVVMATLALTGITLGVASSLFAAIGLGIGSDYALHLGERVRVAAADPLGTRALSRAIQEVGPAIITSAAAVSASMFVLLSSQSPPNRLLGLLVAICLTCTAILTLLVLPLLARASESSR